MFVIGSYESYVRSILAAACPSVREGGLGYRGVVINFRGCASVPITSPMLYSAGYTDDLRTALMYIQNLYPDSPLLGLGFSLGANIMCRYFGEEGKNSRLVSGCVLGCVSHVIMAQQCYISVNLLALESGAEQFSPTTNIHRQACVP